MWVLIFIEESLKNLRSKTISFSNRRIHSIYFASSAAHPQPESHVLCGCTNSVVGFRRGGEAVKSGGFSLPSTSVSKPYTFLSRVRSCIDFLSCRQIFCLSSGLGRYIKWDTYASNRLRCGTLPACRRPEHFWLILKDELMSASQLVTVAAASHTFCLELK
jgi:hypothetical protein